MWPLFQKINPQDLLLQCPIESNPRTNRPQHVHHPPTRPNMKFSAVVFCAAALPLAAAQPAGHEVTSLPGWPHKLPSKHYSGYLPVGTTSGVPGHIHYWFIESENDPANDPVV